MNMKTNIEIFITKKLEKFVSTRQNLIFARIFREKLPALNDKIGAKVENAIKRIVLLYRKYYKQATANTRTKLFLIENINAFENEHNKIVYLIESNCVKERWDEYLVIKSRISAILRANRRLNKLKITSNKAVQSYLNDYINQKRFAKKYELSI